MGAKEKSGLQGSSAATATRSCLLWIDESSSKPNGQRNLRKPLALSGANVSLGRPTPGGYPPAYTVQSPTAA